jgi:hypothetical protein
MLNYYDDVDYGTRLWRAGYKVVVAPDAWIDHGVGAAGGDSPRKRLLCERHRMRVVLKHAPARTLARWAAQEARSLRTAPAPVRLQKLRSIVWNVSYLPSVLTSRRRMRYAPSAPDDLLDGSWGDGFPVGVPLRLRPTPERGGTAVEMGDPDSVGQLLHGWFPPERVDERSYRWAGLRAAVLVHLDEHVARMQLDYAHVPVDIGAIDVQIRRVGSAEPLTPVWATRLLWQYIARSVENHPLALAPGAYEVVFASARGWSDPPDETRLLSFALSSVAFAETFAVTPGGLDMAGADAEEQLVNGWFEAEEGPFGPYRWGTSRAVAVVRLSEPARAARLRYRPPPGPIGGLRVALTPLGTSREAWSTQLPWRESVWREESIALEVAAGDYLLSFDVDTTWSNPEGRDQAAGAESRLLGFALSSFTFAS